MDDNDKRRNIEISDLNKEFDSSTSVWRGKKQHTGYLAEIPVPKCVNIPLTLGIPWQKAGNWWSERQINISH